MPLKILFEDNHLIAAFKKAGQSVQPEPNKPISLEEEVKQYLKEKYNKPGEVFLGVIHRLDMPVSGLVLFAKTSKALVRMNEIFQNREVTKIYRAWVEGCPENESKKLTHYLIRDEKINITKAFSYEKKGSKKAELIYTVIEKQKNKSLLEIELLTGRKHQIRAQLKEIGCPIIGDVKYGASLPLHDKSIALTSYKICFMHPVKNETITITID
ncbi:MAG: RluA family pseudouridine synthase [Bacteroidia bacterium]